MPKLLAAPDKFRGTATASSLAEAMEWAAHDAGWTCDLAPVADGGEGLIDVLEAWLPSASRRRTTVTGPLGEPTEAEWLLAGRRAVIEMARASGLVLAGGPEGNDPMAATTRGTGELVNAAIAAGARRIIVGLGGSATTDGGMGALEVLKPARLHDVDIVVACDVTTLFTDAAIEFGPQKGATERQIALLTRRLEQIPYAAEIKSLPGSGAAGGLAGGLASLGAQLVPGFDLVADLIDLRDRIANADLVITGEGRVDEWSFRGKAVGGVVELADEAGVEVAVIAGGADDGLPMEVVSLSEQFGLERALADPLGCVAQATTRVLAKHG